MNNEKTNVTSGLAATIKNNIMVIAFIILAVFLAAFSGSAFVSIGADVSSRFFRNILLIAALVLPIMSGVGLNFGITLGAMSAEFALVVVMIFQADDLGPVSVALWIIVTILVCVATGWLLAVLFNKCKGHEMIAGLLVGFFANGIYELILMVIFGDILKIDVNGLALAKGLPIKATIGLSDTLNGATDAAMPVAYYYMLFIGAAGLCLYFVISMILNIKKGKERNIEIIKTVAGVIITAGATVFCLNNKGVRKFLVSTNFPFATAIVSAVFILLVVYIMRSKLGHDFISVRNDRKIAASVGINVDRRRTQSIILSTIIAGIGQILYIQNLGTMNTYLMHNTVGTYAIAAILIGGATVKSANIRNVLVGNILFQTIYGCAPNAAKVLMGNSQIGEYFRVFLCYAIIAIAILSNALNEVAIKQRKMEQS